MEDSINSINQRFEKRLTFLTASFHQHAPSGLRKCLLRRRNSCKEPKGYKIYVSLTNFLRI